MTYLDVGKGEVLVFIHGLGSTKESWKYQHELSKRYRLIIPDLRGHGANNVYDEISIETFAKDVITLLDSLEIKQAHFCGLSMGGLVVQEIYKQYPTHVLSMILSNTFSYASFPLAFHSFNLGLKGLNEMTQEEFAEVTARRCLFEKSPALIEEVKKTFFVQKEPYISSSLSAIQKNYLFMLPFVKVPVLVIGSSHDAAIPLFTVYQTAWFTPMSKVYIFRECGHMPNMEKKEEYNQVIHDFLQH